MRQSKRSTTSGRGRNKGTLQDWEGSTKPATVWFGSTMLTMLRAHAQATQRSLSDVVRDACKAYLARNSNNIRQLVEGDK